jgi:hypothetical protein
VEIKMCDEVVTVIEKLGVLLDDAIGQNDLLWEELMNCVCSFFIELWKLGEGDSGIGNDTLSGLKAELDIMPSVMKDALAARIMRMDGQGRSKALQLKMIYGLK